MSGRLRLADRSSLAAIGLSMLAMVQPFFGAGFRLGFFALLASTLAQIVVSHLRERGRA
jgi:hypothetical protein